MAVLEGRRTELGLSMSQVNDITGLHEGYYAKMIYPDTPSGRQARWEQVQLAFEGLFNEGFSISITPGDVQNLVLKSMLCSPKNPSANTVQIRHWRHKKHFQKLGSLGGKAFFEGKDKDERSAIMRKRAKKRWRRIRQAQRQGAEHRDRNAAQKASAAQKPAQRTKSKAIA